MFFALFSDKVKWRKRNNVVASCVSSGEEVYIVFNHNWGRFWCVCVFLPYGKI